MEYFVNNGMWGSVFAVPNSIVDDYIKLASGYAIKVLLYVLRNNNQVVEKQTLSSELNMPIEYVEEAFGFWEQVGLFSQTPVISQTITTTTATENIITQNNPYTETNSQMISNNNAQNITPITSVPEMPKAFAQRTSAGFTISPTEISNRINESDDVSNLFAISERSFNHMLTHTEQRSLIWMHDYLGLKVGVILMLVEHCISIDKANTRYIEEIAVKWCDNGINTLDAVQSELKMMKEQNDFSGQIMRKFQMRQRPTSKQMEYINSWRQKNYNLDLLEYAYEKTIETIEKLSFAYINTIINNWYANGLLTRAKVDEFNQAHKIQYSRYRNSSTANSSYDIDEFESFAINLI